MDPNFLVVREMHTFIMLCGASFQLYNTGIWNISAVKLPDNLCFEILLFISWELYYISQLGKLNLLLPQAFPTYKTFNILTCKAAHDGGGKLLSTIGAASLSVTGLRLNWKNREIDRIHNDVRSLIVDMLVFGFDIDSSCISQLYGADSPLTLAPLKSQAISFARGRIQQTVNKFATRRFLTSNRRKRASIKLTIHESFDPSLQNEMDH